MSLFAPEIRSKAEALIESCRQRRLMLTTAESCTGGLLSALITEIPGSSDVFTHGFVTYANEAKKSMLGVGGLNLKFHGAVSDDVAIAMAEGALKKSEAAISVSITGIAGPGGATPDKPVGLVHLASARKGYKTLHQQFNFSGDRSEVRLRAVLAAIELLQQQLNR